MYPVTSFFNISSVKNYGISFGILNNLNNPKIIFSILTIIMSIYIISLYFKQEFNNLYKKIALSLIISGAYGNMIDRIYNGYVIDFLDFHYKNYHWPSFNIADISICCGVFIIILYDFLNFSCKK